MNNLIESNTVTMSSREIGELVNTQHSDVKRSAERLEKAGLLTQPLAEFDFEHRGNTYTEYRFNKRDSLVLVARLSPEFTAAVVDRWQELESQQPSFNIPTTLSGALQLAADQARQIEQQEQQLAIAAPKVEFYDAVTQSDDAISIGEVAKTLNTKGMGQNKLFKLLRDKGVLQSGGSRHNQPYQKHVDAGRFRLVETSWVTGNGDVRVNMKTVVLQKGLDYIRKLLAE